MSTTDPLPLRLGAPTILGRGVALLLRDPRIPAVHALMGVSIVFPVVGPAVAFGLWGLACQFADETLGYAPPDRSFVRRYLSGLAAGSLSLVLIGVGAVFFIVPGVVLALKFTLVLPAVWLGGMGPIAALADSWELTTKKLTTVLFVGVAVLVPTASVVLIAGLALPDFGAFLETWGTLRPRIRADPGPVAVLVGVFTVFGSLQTAVLTIMYRGFDYP